MSKDSIFYISIVVFSLMIILFGNIAEKYFLNPLNTVLLFPFRHGSAFIENFINMYNENKELKQKLSLYSMRTFMLREIEEENLRLKKMLNFKMGYHYDLIPAEIIGRMFEGGREFVSINVGIKNGINVDMPVITEKGLLGKVVSCGAIESIVQTIQDANFSVIVRDQRSRVTGRLYSVYPGPVIIADFPMYLDIRVGDTLITAGLDDVYPKGIPVGEIKKIYPDENGYFMKSIIMPFYSEGSNEEIFVINRKRIFIQWDEEDTVNVKKSLKRMKLYDWYINIVKPIYYKPKIKKIVNDTVKIDTLKNKGKEGKLNE